MFKVTYASVGIARVSHFIFEDRERVLLCVILNQHIVDEPLIDLVILKLLILEE